MGRTHLAELRRLLLADGLVTETDDLVWMSAEYDSPFILPHNRRNEVWILLNQNNERVKAMLAAIQ